MCGYAFARDPREPDDVLADCCNAYIRDRMIDRRGGLAASFVEREIRRRIRRDQEQQEDHGGGGIG